MADNEESKPSGGGIMGIVKALAVVMVLVVVELVAAAFLFPSAHDTEKLAKEMARAAAGAEQLVEEEDELVVPEITGDTTEVELASDNITRFNPDSDKTLNVTFEIYGVVLKEEQADFQTAFDENKFRLQEQIVMTMHSASTDDLTQDGLGLIKRQILEKTNRTLGKPYLHEVLFSKINFIER